MGAVRALLFDVQGTLVDFYEPLLAMGVESNRRLGLDLDWAAVATRWRALYRAGMDDIIEGRAPWQRVDRIYREALDRIIEDNGLVDRVSPHERDRMNAIWQALEPWPDSVGGLARLRRKFAVATLSNAGMGALVALVKHAGLTFDAIFSAELAKAYKPAPVVYLTACRYLDLPPEAVMMVACHNYDLHAARALGMATAFIERPLEFGPQGDADISGGPAFDFHARSLEHLADQLGA